MIENEKTSDLIRVMASATEPTVQYDFPDACEFWEKWMQDKAYSLDQIMEELENRKFHENI